MLDVLWGNCGVWIELNPVLLEPTVLYNLQPNVIVWLCYAFSHLRCFFYW